MSSIASTIDELLSHPHWQNECDRKIHLIDLCTYLYQQTCEQAARTYRNNRKFTPIECYEAIRDMPPPELAYFIHCIETCPVISIKKATDGQLLEDGVLQA